LSEILLNAATLSDLADFNFIIQYVPGRTNIAADFLSRNMSEPCTSSAESGTAVPPGLALDGGAVPGGGNYLFLSLYRALTAIYEEEQLPGSATELRRQLCDELLGSLSKYGFGKPDRQLRRSLRLMRLCDQVPCLEVLIAASFLYKVKVFVYFWPNQPIVYLDQRVAQECKKIVHLQCLGGIHFNALKEAHEYVPADLLKLKCITVPITRHKISWWTGRDRDCYRV
jgi:hypothetical protein